MLENLFEDLKSLTSKLHFWAAHDLELRLALYKMMREALNPGFHDSSNFPSKFQTHGKTTI